MIKYLESQDSDLIFAATSALIFTSSGHYTNKNRVSAYPGCLQSLISLLSSPNAEHKDRAAGVVTIFDLLWFHLLLQL